MKMSINVRPLVKELLENEYLIVNYNELNDGGFDLSVRINEEKFNTTEKINKIRDERLDELKKDKTDSIVYVPGKDLLGRPYNIVVQRKATKINV